MLMILICCGALGFAQEPAAGTSKDVKAVTAAAERPKYLQKVIDVKHGEVGALAKLLGNLAPSMTTVSAQPDLQAISIGTYDPSFLVLADEVVKRYDVARQSQPATQLHDIELVAYILIASPKGTAGDALPPDLDGVAKQLRSLFGYRDLKLLDTAWIRAIEHSSGAVSGSVAGLAEGSKVPSKYTMRFKSASVGAEEKGNVIYLSDFMFNYQLPYEAAMGTTSWVDLGFNTDLSIADSQKVVVGKSKIGSADQALVLVLSARVVN
jgi:hypothetical protein